MATIQPTQNILDSVISPKIVGNSSGYQVKTDIQNIDILTAENVVTPLISNPSGITFNNDVTLKTGIIKKTDGILSVIGNQIDLTSNNDINLYSGQNMNIHPVGDYTLQGAGSVYFGLPNISVQPNYPINNFLVHATGDIKIGRNGDSTSLTLDTHGVLNIGTDKDTQDINIASKSNINIGSDNTGIITIKNKNIINIGDVSYTPNINLNCSGKIYANAPVMLSSNCGQINLSAGYSTVNNSNITAGSIILLTPVLGSTYSQIAYSQPALVSFSIDHVDSSNIYINSTTNFPSVGKYVIFSDAVGSLSANTFYYVKSFIPASSGVLANISVSLTPDGNTISPSGSTYTGNVTGYPISFIDSVSKHQYSYLAKNGSFTIYSSNNLDTSTINWFVAKF